MIDPRKDLTTPPPPPEGVVHTAWVKAWDMAQTLPALERQAIAESLEVLSDLDRADVNTAFCALYKVLYARYRGRMIARNDKQSRTIIGARVPRAFAEQCKWVAQNQGLSTTRWCYKALLTALTHDMACATHYDALADPDDYDPAAWLL